MRPEPKPEVEIAIAAAATLIKNGVEPAKVLRFIHTLGYTTGALDANTASARAIRQAFETVLKGSGREEISNVVPIRP